MAKKSISNSAATSAETADLTTCLAILNGVQDQVRFADRKAAFFSALNALMFGFASRGGFVLREALDTQGIAFWTAAVFMILFTVAAATSMVFVVSSVMSRFGELAPKSKVYFGHIVTQYGKDYSRYVADMKAMSDADWAEEIGTQIVEVSHIASTKHNLLRNAAKVSLLAFALWVLLVAALTFVPTPEM